MLRTGQGMVLWGKEGIREQRRLGVEKSLRLRAMKLVHWALPRTKGLGQWPRTSPLPRVPPHPVAR